MKLHLYLVVLALSLAPACKKRKHKPSQLTSVVEQCGNGQTETLNPADLWFLSTGEYQNSLNDLLAVEYDWAQAIPGHTGGQFRFIEGSTIDPVTMAAYARNAIKAATWFTEKYDVLSGEFGAWPTHYEGFSMADVRAAYSFLPEVDGDLESYWLRYTAFPLENLVIGTGISEEDFSASARYVLSDQGLAVFTEVVDDNVLGRAEAAAYDQDSIEIFLDVNGVNDGPYQQSSVQITIPFEGDIFTSQNLTGLLSAKKQTPSGISWEVFVPWDAFGLTAKPSKVSLDIQVNDGDTAAGRDAKRSWSATVDDAYQNLASLRLVHANQRFSDPRDIVKESCEPNQPKACLRKFLLSFGERVFRRPLSQQQIARYSEFFEESASIDSLRQLIAALLVAPDFLYRIDYPSEDNKNIDSYALASRISYTLWKSMPNRALFQAAKDKKLNATDQSSFNRAWESDRSVIGVVSFINSLLEINRVEYALKDEAAYPGFSKSVGRMIDIENHQFIYQTVFKEEDSFDKLFTSQTSFVTADLNPILRSSTTGAGWQQTTLGQDHAGILTRPAFLATHAKDSNSDHIARGVTILDHLLCSPITDPPGNLGTENPSLDPDASPRENFESLVTAGSCAGCHKKIDPVGFAFDNFDAIGAIRTELGGHPIATAGSLPNGFDFKSFSGAVDISRKIAASPVVKSCITKQALIQVVGFTVDDSKQGCSLTENTQKLVEHKDFKSLFFDLIYSRASRSRLFSN